METVKVDLGGGAWAELLAQTMHLTTKRVRAAMRKYRAPMLVDTNTVQSALPDKIDLATFDVDEINEIVILSQVKAWSFGDISQVVLDAMPTTQYDALVREVDRLYGGDPLPVSTAAN